MNLNIQKEVKDRVEKAPLSISFDNPEWSSVVNMCRDASQQHLYALESAITQVGQKSFLINQFMGVDGWILVLSGYLSNSSR